MDLNTVSTLAAPRAGHDKAFDLTPLSEDHAPKFWAEAKRIYSEDEKPPFVTGVGKGIEGSMRDVFITKDGQRPTEPIRAKLVARRWSQPDWFGIYWTLDLNGERLIVVAFPNNGCLNDARWVYCCWKGTRDDFEDLPLAFTFINGEYTTVLGPRQRITQKNTNSLPHGRIPRWTPLHKNHPIEYQKEATALYKGLKPLFGVRKVKHTHRRVLLATQDGRFSPTSTVAEVVCRAWGKIYDCATLDLDGKRFFVIGNAGGGAGGYRYHLWLGPEAGRIEKVVAFSATQAAVSKARSGLTKHQVEADEETASLSSSECEEDQDLQTDAEGTSDYSYGGFTKAFDPTAMPSAPIQFRKRRSVSSSESATREERIRRKTKPTKRARSPTPLAHFGSRKGNTPANVAKRSSYWFHQESEGSSNISDPPDAPYETPIRTPSTNNNPPPTAETQDQQTQTPAYLPALSLHKQNYTRLRVNRDSNVIGFVPLRLKSCMTMDTFFKSIIAASGHPEQVEPVQSLMAVFDWKEENDIYRTIHIHKGTPTSFEIFLEIIDEAPCWKDEGGKEGGKCDIAVEIDRN